MSRSTLEPHYFDRMAAAAEEKLELTAHIVPGSVADIGAGGGELSRRLSERPEVTDAWAIDNSIDSIRRLNQIPSIHSLFGSTERLTEFAGEHGVDNIVFSSVLHEVWSYAPQGLQDYAWEKALRDAVDALAPGGRLIIRDFVLPERPDERAVLRTPGDAEDAMIYDYLEQTPFHDLQVLDEIDEHVFVGTRRTVSEALLTVNWGPRSLARESQERYGLHTLDEYSGCVLALSDEISRLTSVSQVQPGYIEHLSEWSCFVEDGTSWFPDTKALWVFEKKTA